MEDEAHIDWKSRCLALQKQVEQLLEENRLLREENRQLRERLNTNSNNSSKPPSQDPYRNPRKHNPTGRKQGAQPGHPGYQKQMISMEKVAAVVDLKAPFCPDCGINTLETAPVSIECRQTIELPVIQPEVTQYNIYTLRCACCGKHIRPEIPREAEKGFGPRLMGFVTMLTGEVGATKRKICSVVGYLGMKISLGSLCNIHRLASKLLEKPFADIRNAVLMACTVNADETSWRLKRQRQWVWIGATPTAVFLQIDSSRSRAAFERVFGGFQGTLSTDRYAAYHSHIGKRQLCLAHVARDFAKMSERPSAAGALGRILVDELGKIFGLWKQYQEKVIDRTSLQEKALGHIENIRDALTIAASSREIDSKSTNFCCNLLDDFSLLWTFLNEEGVEPTNNLAERGLRPAVVCRKISGGSQSEWGLRFIERLLTVTGTMRQQAKNLFEFLSSVFEAWFSGSPSPPVPI